MSAMRWQLQHRRAFRWSHKAMQLKESRLTLVIDLRSGSRGTPSPLMHWTPHHFRQWRAEWRDEVYFNNDQMARHWCPFILQRNNWPRNANRSPHENGLQILPCYFLDGWRGCGDLRELKGALPGYHIQHTKGVFPGYRIRNTKGALPGYRIRNIKGTLPGYRIWNTKGALLRYRIRNTKEVMPKHRSSYTHMASKPELECS